MNSKKIIEKWINGKFDSKIVLGLIQREEFLNIQISVINGKEFSTKLGSAMQTQLGLNDLKKIHETAQEIIIEHEKRNATVTEEHQNTKEDKKSIESSEDKKSIPA